MGQEIGSGWGGFGVSRGQGATYETVKNAHLDASYRQANILLEQEMFDEALVEFDAILKLDPAYQDAPALRNVSYCEPRYRRGVWPKRRTNSVPHTAIFRSDRH